MAPVSPRSSGRRERSRSCRPGRCAFTSAAPVTSRAPSRSTASPPTGPRTGTAPPDGSARGRSRDAAEPLPSTARYARAAFGRASPRIRSRRSRESAWHASWHRRCSRSSGMNGQRPPIREWPPEDRPRERFLTKGAEALSDAECLALLLGSGVPGQSALDQAQALLAAFGSIAAVADREVQELAWVGGLGIAKAVRLGAAIELSRRLRARPNGGRVR